MELGGRRERKEKEGSGEEGVGRRDGRREVRRG